MNLTIQHNNLDGHEGPGYAKSNKEINDFRNEHDTNRDYFSFPFKNIPINAKKNY